MFLPLRRRILQNKGAFKAQSGDSVEKQAEVLEVGMREQNSSLDFRRLFEGIPGPYLILKADAPRFTIEAVSDAYLAATMTQRNQIVGRGLFEVFPDNPDDPTASGTMNLNTSLNRVLKTRAAHTMAIQKYDIQRPQEEGGGFEERFWSPTNAPLFSESGELTHIIHRVEDVTEFIHLKNRGIQQEKLTEELKIHSQHLESEVYLRVQQIQQSNEKLLALNQNLEETNKKLKEAESAKDNFLASVSHELRTPLTLILAPVESLLGDKGYSESSTEKQHLFTVHNNALRLLQMINGILDFSKLQSGKMEVVREPIDVVELTETIVRDFTPSATAKQLSLSFQSELKTHVVEMDRFLYEKILFNLLSNSTKFTPAGGEISVRITAEGNRLLLAVKDTGVGISVEDQKNLFQRFCQLENSSIRRYEGTGLGLSLVKEFVTLLGGTVSVQSGEKDKGSLFTVQMHAPTSILKPRSHARVVKIQQVFRRKEKQVVENTLSSIALPKILIAEDNEELRYYITSLLEGMATVHLARDGEEALELAKNLAPDLILSDVMMPKIDGMNLCHLLKTNNHTAQIPIVLLTALTHRESLLKGWEVGADDYLFKPFHPVELQTRVRSLLHLVKLKKLREEEKIRMHHLEDFAFVASHDLREPLRTIKLYSQLLLEPTPTKSPEERREFLETIISGADHMRRLIDDLITYALAQKVETQMEPVNAKQAWEQALKNLKFEIDLVNPTFIVDTLPIINFNFTKLVQVFQNLVQNALKFRQNQTPVIRVQAKLVGNEWVFSLKDNGIGFDKKYAEDVFLVFRRLNHQVPSSGNGIGLAVCRTIIQRMGGRIWADSVPLEGTTFYFTVRNTVSEERNGRKIAQR